MRVGLARHAWVFSGLFGLACPLVAAAQSTAPSSAPETAPAAGQAQPSALRVAVLRTTRGDAAGSANAVDGALLRDLAGLAGIDNPTVSPIDYAEIQLTVGCSDEGRQCLSSIAQMVQVGAVVVRRLVVEPGRVTLSLIHFDATASDEPAHAEQVFEGPNAAGAAAAAVPSLVRRLFGIPEPVLVAAPPPQQQRSVLPAPQSGPTDAKQENHPSVGALTWVTLGAGAAILTGGFVVGASAKSDFDAFKAIKVKNEQDAQRASTKFDSVQSKSLAANILMPSGAAVLALGATLLVLDLTRDDKSGPELGVRSLRGGGLLTVRGTMGGL
jgi:hypothetical protein